jgi:LysR family transcriptional regulator, glycine cleavage system transcriptional activator
MTGTGPPLNALQAFVAVCEAGSVREAGRRLGIGHSAVSRHLQSLQEWAGCRLIETGPGGVILTESGQHVLERISPAFAAIRALREEFRPTGDLRGLEIWCVPGLSARWLSSRLEALRALLGQRLIVVRPTDQMPNLSQGEADAAIRYGCLPEGAPDLAGVELCRPAFFPVASRTWLQLNAVPKTPAELPAASLLHEHSDAQWLRWLATVGVDSIRALPGPRLWYASMSLDAAEHGQGVAIANSVLAYGALQAGNLVAVTEAAAALDPYVLLTDRRRWNDPMIVRLRTWLLSELSPFNMTAPVTARVANSQ